MGDKPSEELLLAHKELDDAIHATLNHVDSTSDWARDLYRLGRYAFQLTAIGGPPMRRSALPLLSHAHDAQFGYDIVVKAYNRWVRHMRGYVAIPGLSGRDLFKLLEDVRIVNLATPQVLARRRMILDPDDRQVPDFLDPDDRQLPDFDQDLDVPTLPRGNVSEPALRRLLSKMAVGSDAWKKLAEALSEPGSGFVYIGGDPTAEQIEAIEKAVAEAAAEGGAVLTWKASDTGSWFRKFVTLVRRRFGEHDLDTVKRAGDVHLLDRWEAPAASNYAGAIASLATAAAPFDHAVFVAKNTVLVKTKNAAGEEIVISRTLTSAEVNELSAKPDWLSDPKKALDFITRAPITTQMTPTALPQQAGLQPLVPDDQERPSLGT